MAMKGRIEEYTSAVREAERGAVALRELVALVEVEETLAWSNGSSEREALEGLRALAAGGALLPPRLMEVVAKEFVARNGFKMESEARGASSSIAWSRRRLRAPAAAAIDVRQDGADLDLAAQDLRARLRAGDGAIA